MWRVDVKAPRGSMDKEQGESRIGRMGFNTETREGTSEASMKATDSFCHDSDKQDN